MAKHVIVVTGASSGFGTMTARALAQAGHIVYASMRETQAARTPGRRRRGSAVGSGGPAHLVSLDVQVRRIVGSGDRPSRRCSRLDVKCPSPGI